MKKPDVVNKHIQLSRYEADLLHKLAWDTGSSEVEVIRSMLMKYRIPEKPDERFYKCMEDIRKIGVNINQIAHVANATGVIEADAYKAEADKLDQLVLDLKRICLEPTKRMNMVQLINELEYIMWETLEEQHECWAIQARLKKMLHIDVKGHIGNGDY